MRRIRCFTVLCLLLTAASLQAQDRVRAPARDAESCRVREVSGLPGSREFASRFMETMATDPGDPGTVWGLTADLSTRVPEAGRVIYLSKSVDGGATWTEAAHLDARYFNASIAEGLRNGLAVAPGAKDFVITTQEGAFQVTPQSDGGDARVTPIAGPRVPASMSLLSLPKSVGDPVRANVVLISADGRRMVLGFGYFDMHPQLFAYRRNAQGGWVEDGEIQNLPTDLDLFSMQFDHARSRRPRWLYVGFGDQAYRLDLRTLKRRRQTWIRIRGVGPDSAIHSMTTIDGLHLAACWGVYEPVDAETVARVTHARFLLHRWLDEVGPNIRAYGIEVDARRPRREVLTAITGVYTTSDGGKTWKRLNDLPEGEYHTAHVNADGTVIVSGIPGTFVANPFSPACSPHLRHRAE